MGKVELLLLQSEFDLLQQLVKLLKTFDTWTKSIQTDYVSLSNAVLMREHLYEMVMEPSENRIIKDIKNKMLVAWDSRIPSLGIHYLAALLDPTLKTLKSVEDFFVAHDKTSFVMQMLGELSIPLDKLYPPPTPEPTASVATSSSDTPTARTAQDPDANTAQDPDSPTEPEVEEIPLKRPPSKADIKSDEAKKRRLELIKRYSISPASSVDNSLATRKLSLEIGNYCMMVHDMEMDPMEFWRDKKEMFPGLRQLARVIHAVPATSAEIERVWSTSGLILSSRRSKLLPQNYKHWIFARYNWEITREFVESL